MLSGIGPCDALRRLGIETLIDLPGVGRNLQDHPLVTGLCFEAKHPLPALNNNLGGSSSFWRSQPGLDRPDLVIFPVQVPLVSEEIRGEYQIPPNAFCIVLGLMRVQSRGYVPLTSRQPDGPLEIQPNFLKESSDLDALVSAVELGLDTASQPAYRDLVRRWVAPTKRLSRDEAVTFVRRACSTYNHPVGTCAMGQGKEAVVDAELRVHGVESLRIADASVMPTIPSANTNAPAVMIGEFASRLLVDQRNLYAQADQDHSKFKYRANPSLVV